MRGTRKNVAPQQLLKNKVLKMKFDFHIRAAAEIPVAEALRPQIGTEMTATDRCTASQPAPASGLSLLARRQVRLARRATR
jgi:hypothetical protein